MTSTGMSGIRCESGKKAAATPSAGKIDQFLTRSRSHNQKNTRHLRNDIPEMSGKT